MLLKYVIYNKCIFDSGDKKWYQQWDIAFIKNMVYLFAKYIKYKYHIKKYLIVKLFTNDRKNLTWFNSNKINKVNLTILY